MNYLRLDYHIYSILYLFFSYIRSVSVTALKKAGMAIEAYSKKNDTLDVIFWLLES
jgi:hypothetical protein